MNVPIDISDVILTTPRLILRPWRTSDLDDLYEYSRVPDLGRMAGWITPEAVEDSEAVLGMFIRGKSTFAIEYRGRAVGSIGVDRYDETHLPEFDDMRCREIGYVLSKDLWGQGLMPEAVSEVVRWLFEEQDLDLIVCGHFAWNNQSARAQEKCGFKYYKTVKLWTDYGTQEDDMVSILTKEEWTAFKKA